MKRAARIYVVLALIFIGSSAVAAPEDTTCTASAPTINFGSFDVLGGSTLPAAGSFTVTCTHNKNTTVTVTYAAKLDIAPTRQLAPPSGTDRVSYQLYTDSARTQVWGDGSSGTFTITGTVTINGATSVTDAAKNFYGLITPGGQDVSATSPAPPTTYSQTLTITVTCTPTTVGC